MTEQTQKLIPETPVNAMFITLGLVAMVSGLLVVFTSIYTAPMIEENKREAIEKAVFTVIPGAVTRKDFIVADGKITPAQDKISKGITVYAGYDKNDRFIGLATDAAAQGYANLIRLLYGYDPRCQCITGIKVIKLAETPGLGDKIITDAEFNENFRALDARLNADASKLANDIVTVKHGTKTEPWQIDAITGATISSQAVGRALNSSTNFLLPQIAGQDAVFKGEQP
ncbi:MAG: FMN-binding protein [Gammaproteobacteria bacterium]|nr:MAG: FMN-binding protein [Gammaproteobacteria bacterium]